MLCAGPPTSFCMTGFTITAGFTNEERPQVARLYWQAFRGKLGRVMAPEDKALAFLGAIMKPDFALTARDIDGRLLGLAGFKTEKGSLTDAGFRDLARHYGLLSSLWRGMVLAGLERDLTPDTLLMDGICVDPSARGLGVGTALLAQIEATAREKGLSRVRLDVIDSNPRARALYDRLGYIAQDEMRTGPFRAILGFETATRMEKVLIGTPCRDAAN